MASKIAILLVINTTGIDIPLEHMEQYHCGLIYTTPTSDAQYLIDEWYEKSNCTDLDKYSKLQHAALQAILATRLEGLFHIARKQREQYTTFPPLYAEMFAVAFGDRVGTIVLIDRKRILNDEYYLQSQKFIQGYANCVLIDINDFINSNSVDNLIAEQNHRDDELKQAIDY